MAKDKDKAIHGPTLDECGKKYLVSRESELGETAMDQYRLMLDRLGKYCAKHGVRHMSELTVDLLEDFKVDGLPKLADASKAMYVAKMRCFLRDAYRRGWLKETLAEKVKPHRIVFVEKSPFDIEEVNLILAGASAMKGGRQGYGGKPETFRLLLELMLETGLRVSDAIQFNPAKVTKGERMWIYRFRQQKDKKVQKIRTTEVYLTDRLKKAIDDSVWYSKALPFSIGSSNEPGIEVYKTMQAVGSSCGVDDCRPHRLRDTFAVRKLVAGLKLDDVSRLLGHSSVAVTERYYAKWIPARQSRLERVLADSLVDA